MIAYDNSTVYITNKVMSNNLAKHLFQDKKDNKKPKAQTYKDVLIEFLGEAGFHLLFYALFGSIFGLYVMIGFWAIVGILPIVFCVYCVIKYFKGKYTQKSKK